MTLVCSQCLLEVILQFELVESIGIEDQSCKKQSQLSSYHLKFRIHTQIVEFGRALMRYGIIDIFTSTSLHPSVARSATEIWLRFRR